MADSSRRTQFGQPPLAVGSMVVMLLGAACGQSAAAPNEGAGAAAARQTESAPQGGTAAASGAMLEFDLPDEFWSRPVGAGDAITGFRVGVFRAGSDAPVQTLDFARDSLTVQRRAGRVPLPATLPQGADVTLRVQALSGAGPSVWSGPVPLAGFDRAARASAERGGTAPRARNRRDGLAPADLEPYPALAAALRQLLPSDTPVEEAMGRFRRIEDLALAVVLSRDHDIPFTTLSEKHAGPPRQTIRNAVVEIRADADARRLVREARPAAKELLSQAGRSAK